MAGAPAAGPALACGRRVPDLGYADDFCLLASSAADLQRLLDIAYGFLNSIGMELSFDKTKVVAFGCASANAAAASAWTYGGHPLQCAPAYKYLGVTFSTADGVAAAFLPLSGKLHGAWATLQQRFGEVHDGISLALMRALFQSAVPPAESYACEVWGVRFLRGQAAAAREHLVRSHLQLYKRLLRVPDSVARELVLRELGMHSPEWLWLRSACRFWNALCAAPEGSLHKAVALSDWADAGRRRPPRNWAWSLQQRLSDLGYVFHLDHRCMIPIDVAAALTLLDAREQQCWDCDVCPRTCATVGATYCKYLRWFALPDGAASNAFFRLPLGPSRVFQIVRFRLGCHKLPIVTRRNQGRSSRCPALLAL